MAEALLLEKNPEEASIELLESGVVVLYLSRDSSSPVTLTIPRMESIARFLRQVREQRPAGLVITSGGSGGFCTGLDSSVKASFSSALEAETLAQSGQELCRAIESLPFPVVAAVHGPCLAEGFELALACTYRIAGNDARTILGLPHVPLGLIPAFGTLGRLSRIVELRSALEVVLDGRILKPGEALSLQLIHEMVPAQGLLDHAAKIASGAYIPRRLQRSVRDRILGRTRYGRRYLRSRVDDSIFRSPAPEASQAAVDSLFSSFEKPSRWRGDHDAHVFGKLAVREESRSLLRIAELKDSALQVGNSSLRDVEHVHALVLGSGHMGAGIAGALAANDCGVILKDPDPAQLRRGIGQIRKFVSSIRGLNEAERSFVLNRIEMIQRESANFGNTNIAIEAVQEDRKVKEKTLSELCEVIPEEAVIATNTSSYPITSLAGSVKYPSRFIGLHFFSPVESHDLVEVVMGKQTGNRAIAIASALVCRMGKYPIVVHDVPGFLVNRILSPYFQEAFHLLHEGYTVRDIDAAAGHFGMRSGPFGALDAMGLDVAAQYMEGLSVEHGEQLRAHAFCSALLQAGRRGRKSSGGFYDYGRKEPVPFEDLRSILHITAVERAGVDLQSLEERLVLALVNESVDCLDGGIAGRPGVEAANQIDLGMVLGGGFPAVRGGPLFYADSIGAEPLAERLKKLEVKHGSRFRAAEGILRRARTGGFFSHA